MKRVNISKLTDDEKLDYTNDIRNKLILKLTKDGAPEDTKSQFVLLTALSDMDRSSINKKRIGVARQQMEIDLVVAKAIATLSNTIDTNPFENKNSVRQMPNLILEKLPKANPVEGETAIGIMEGNYDELIKRFD